MACSLDRTRNQMESLKLIDSNGFIVKKESDLYDKALYDARQSTNQKDKNDYIQIANKEFAKIPKEQADKLEAYKTTLINRAKEKFDYSKAKGFEKIPFDISAGKIIFNAAFFDWVDRNNADKTSLQKSTDRLLEPLTASDLNDTIKAFLSKIGVSVENVDNLKDANGNSIDGIALANILDKVIQVVNNKAGVDTLTEEAVHFFVEMLPEDSHLFQTMFNSIETYEIYKEVLEEYKEDPLYKGNTKKLKKEAIAKLITRHIVDQFSGNESQKNIEKANKWWNLLIQWFKKKFFNFNTTGFYDAAKRANAFEASASMILKGDISELRNTDSAEMFLQKTPSDAATKVKTTIEENANKLRYDENVVNPRTGKKGVYFYKPDANTQEKQVKNRTTDLVERLEKTRGWSERSEAEKARDEKTALAGNKIHAALKNIINRYSESLQGRAVTAKNLHGVTEGQYESLKTYVEKLFKSYPPGSIFLAETLVYNEKEDRAGTIDLTVIRPDGTVDIYDWKSISLTGKSSIPWYKEENWNIQLTSYKNALKSYGLTKFGRIRVIPISTKFDKNMKLSSISIGTEELSQVPITGLKGSDIEFTGDPNIDKLIEILAQRLQKVSEIKIPYGEVKKQQIKIARMEKLKASIKELQVKQSYEAFLDEAKFELNLIKNAGIENYDNGELLEARNAVNFYARILEEKLISKKALKENYEDFSEVQITASNIFGDINAEIENRAIQIADSVKVTDILEPQEEAHVLSRWFRSISQSNHPIIKSFYKLMSKQKDKVYKESQDLYNKIQNSVSELKEWSKNQGISGVDIFKPFLKYDEKGNWTGNLIPKYNGEFYKLREKYIENADPLALEWLKENTVFDAERFNKMLKENVATWEKIFKNDKNKKAIIEKKIKDFNRKFNVVTNPFTAYKEQNFLVTPKEKWYSKEYKEIMSTPALKNFYMLFTETIKQNSEYIDVKLKTNFVPNIHNDLIDGIAQNGFFSVAGLKDSFVNAVTVKSDSNYGMVDETTGEYKKQIPIYYTEQIEPDSKSRDLGRSLFLFANMALNHKYMQEIEASSHVLKDILERSSRTIVTDATGKVVKNPLTGKVQQVLNSNDTLDSFNKYMDYYLYGITTSGTDKPIEIKGKNVSTKKILSQSLKFFSAKSLSLNLVSGFANLFGGNVNALMEGSKGRFYTKTQYWNSLRMLGQKTVGLTDGKPYHAIEFWDIDSTETNFKKANKLSASAITKNMTFDKFYLLQQKGEWLVENGVLLSMLQSHTIRDGQIVKKKDSETSLFDMMEVVDDKVTIPGLKEEEYANFRRKVKYLYSTMKGNMNNDDISLSKLTVLGQVMMQFKNWIPRMADERFGNLRYVEDLGVWESGKYRSFLKHVSDTVTGNFTNLVTGLFANGLLGIGAGFGANSIKQAAEKHYDQLSEEEKSKISREEYAEMYLANIKASAAEIQLIIATWVLLSLLKGDDDDERTPMQRYFIKQASRNFDEVAFFVSPESASSIIGYGKPAIPILGLLVDIGNLGSDFFGETVGLITADEERLKKNRPVGRFLNLFPATNSLEKLWRDISDEN